MKEMKINIHTLMNGKDTLFAKQRDISCIEDAVYDNNR